MATDLVDRMSTKSDAELLEMLHDSAQYRPEVLELAVQEATNRGLSLEPPPRDAGPAQVRPRIATPKPGFVYYAAGRLVACPHCSGKRFFQRRVRLTSAFPLLNLDWLNPAVFALTCIACSRIEWFAHVESRDDELRQSE